MALQIQKQKKKQKQKKGKFRSNVSETGGNWEHKFAQQKTSINNCKFFKRTREKVIKLFDNFHTTKYKYT